MNIFKRLFGKSEEKNIDRNDASLQEKSEAVSILERIVPIIKMGYENDRKYTTTDGQEIELAESSFPTLKRIGETELSVLIAIEFNEHYEWLQNKNLELSIDETIKLAYQNLISKDDLSIGQVDKSGLELCKVGVLQTTSGLASSYILVESIWEKIFQFCESEEVTFIIPTQNNLLFCSSNDKNFEQAELFLTAMNEYLPTQQPKPLSKSIFTKRKGEVIKLKY
jgi:hypothetical protein